MAATAAAVRFCSTCGGGDFCLPHCARTPGRVQYQQRRAYIARVMLATASNDEQRRYWSGQLAAASAALMTGELAMAA